MILRPGHTDQGGIQRVGNRWIHVGGRESERESGDISPVFVSEEGIKCGETKAKNAYTFRRTRQPRLYTRKWGYKWRRSRLVAVRRNKIPPPAQPEENMIPGAARARHISAEESEENPMPATKYRSDMGIAPYIVSQSRIRGNRGMNGPKMDYRTRNAR
ncbi:hypothetical protein C8R44DRAFT_745961 [Mycena epipterygia]|nr:hypothetical protein C8R44DRAFT_745961 [Mycena epipterygia]